MYNKESGFGRLLAQDVQSGRFGKVFVVGKSGLAHRQALQELYDYDKEGKLRFVSTIDAAVGLCTASAGDRIIVMPGHTETLSNATSLVLDVAGVKILGLGEGTLIPTITLDTATTASIPVSAADVTVENIKFSANFADIVTLFTLTTAKNFTLKKCKFAATATNMNFLAITDTNTTDNAADGLTIEDCSWIEPDLATLYLVKGDADMDSVSLKRNYVNLGVNVSDLPALVNMATGKDLTNFACEDNKVIRLNDANPLLVVTDTTTANTGYLKGNFVRHLDTAGELLVTTGTNFGMFENMATAAVDASAYRLPAQDS